MRCTKAQHRLSVRMDGELSARRARALTRHLEGCEVCRRESARLAEVEARLDALDETSVSADFVSGFARRLELEEDPLRACPGPLVMRRGMRVPRLTLAELVAAAAMLLIGLGMAWGVVRDRKPGPMEAAPPGSSADIAAQYGSSADIAAQYGSSADIAAQAEKIFKETFGGVLSPESAGARYLALLRPEGR